MLPSPFRIRHPPLPARRSPAAPLRAASARRCEPEFARSRDVFARYMDSAAAEIFHREDDAAFMQIAMMVVLGEREKHAKMPLGRGEEIVFVAIRSLALVPFLGTATANREKSHGFPTHSSKRNKVGDDMTASDLLVSLKGLRFDANDR